MTSTFENAYCNGTIEKGDNDYEIIVKGAINTKVANDTMYYIAGAPPDFKMSCSGSALPFASQIQAFDNTPNKGKVKVQNDGTFEIKLLLPNAYYVGLGTVYVPPKVYLQYYDANNKPRNVSILLSRGIPYRSLTHPGTGQYTSGRANTMFYATQFFLPIRSQEQILRDSAYPKQNMMAKDFWGLKPPL